MLACIAAYLVTALIMPRSILTEKLSRRGFHLTREYGVDPLELVLVREAMAPVTPCRDAHPAFYTFADATTRGAAEIMAEQGLETLPVLDRNTRHICGELSLRDLLQGRNRALERENERLRLFNYIAPEQGGHN